MKEKKIVPASADTDYDEFDNLDGMTAEEDSESYLDAIDNAGCPRKPIPSNPKDRTRKGSSRFVSKLSPSRA
ncbi:MAG: hypothetical protein K6G18_03080 [Treponema sp.]|nr:hypothetical protein [Treponema sp.]